MNLKIYWRVFAVMAAITPAFSQHSYAGRVTLEKVKEMSWQFTYVEPESGKFDCTSVPGFDYLILRYHSPSGFVDDQPSYDVTSVAVGFAIPSSERSKSYTESEDARRLATEEACNYIDSLYKQHPSFLPFGVPISEFHPLGGERADESILPDSMHNFSIIPKKYLPRDYLQSRGKDNAPNESVEIFGNNESDDIVIISGKYYYQVTFGVNSSTSIRKLLVCRAEIPFNGMLSFPLHGVRCLYNSKN